MAGLFKIARLVGIEVGLGSADFAYQQVEVRKLFSVPDKSGKREFLDRHRLPPARSIAGRVEENGNF
jgi:hypothetical protein